MCDNPLAHIRIRTARGEISRYWSSYIKLNYLLSSDSIHFLAFSLASRDAGLWIRSKTYSPLAAPFNCPHTINSLVFFKIEQLISTIFLYPAHICIVALFYEKRTRYFLLPIIIAYFLLPALQFLHFTSSFNRPILLSQVRTNGPTTNHSRFPTRKYSFRRKPINPIERISEALCAPLWKAMTRIHTNKLKLFRDPARHRRKENENTGRIAEQREKR